jgi:hypothetical protein
VLENRVLGRIFRAKWGEVKEEWRRLHSQELKGLYSPQNTFGVVKPRRMRWAGHVAHMG